MRGKKRKKKKGKTMKIMLRKQNETKTKKPLTANYIIQQLATNAHPKKNDK